MATMRSAWGAAKQMASAMNRTFMEYKMVGSGKNIYPKFRDGTVVLKRSSHPTKRLYVIGIADLHAPLRYRNIFGARSFSASELLNLSGILNTLWAYGMRRTKPPMKKHKASKTMGFEKWKSGW